MSDDEYGEPINLAAAEQAGTWPYDQQGAKPPTGPDSLHVPDAARRAYVEITNNLLLVSKGAREPGPASYIDNIRAIATPVVAAYLREFAEHAEREFTDEEREQPYATGVLEAARNARRRADRIDPDGAFRGAGQAVVEPPR